MTHPALCLTLERLTTEAFAPFGDLPAHAQGGGRAVNAGMARRSDVPGDHAPDAAPSLAIYRLLPQELPLTVGLFERHPQSAQLFAALTVTRFVAVVAPAGADGLPDLGHARAFLGGPGQVLRYGRDQWHAPMIALGAEGDMLMLAWERGRADDCVEHRLTDPLVILPDLKS